jgi:ribonuclease R
MAGKKQKEGKQDPRALNNAIVTLFRDHPARNMNYKQALKLLSQSEPVLFSKYFFDEDRQANRDLMVSLLDGLVEQEELQITDRGRYRAVPVEQFVDGIIDITSTGVAYVMNDHFEDDIFVAPGHTGTALNGDLVKVLLSATRPGGRRSGKVVEIIKRAKTEVVGTIQVMQKFAFLVPDSTRSNIDVFIPLSKLNGGQNGQKAIARIIEWVPGTKNPTGEIVEVLGEPGDNNAEMNAILAEYGFPLRFPKAVEDEAEKIPFAIPKSEIKKRRDMRDVITFTIDPADAKDFDDALSVKYLDDGTYEIGVHIADVSHYLHTGTKMDEEAVDRATSIYLVDRVIPMLPEKLSNHVCSLRPKEDKLCYSAVFVINNEAEVLEQWFGRTVIHSDKRFTYEEAQSVIEEGKGTLSGEILLLDKLAKKLRQQRFKQGAISFEKVEIKFHLDDRGNPTGVYTKENKDSNKLIEEFMLLANRKVAEFIGKHGGVYPNQQQEKAAIRPPIFVYRIHDSPATDKLERFAAFAGKFGYRIQTKSDKEIAHSLNKLMHDVRGKKEQNVLEQLAIRTMSKAVYTTENIGHYGLAFDYYTHFTSPIRRYPDVLVHRLLDHYLKGGKSVAKKEYEDMCQHATDMEIKASEAERASIKYKQVQYLQDKKDQVFDGIISGVTEWGFYVEITDGKCEGLVRLRDIGNDYYELDEEHYCIRGVRSGKMFQLGDEVQVVIKNTDLTKKQIDFVLHDFDDLPARKSDGGRKKDRDRGKNGKGKGKKRGRR